MIGYDDPRREDGDENAWDDRPSALCEACEERPGAVAEDGAWLCLICSSALEIGHATPAAADKPAPVESLLDEDDLAVIAMDNDPAAADEERQAT